MKYLLLAFLFVGCATEKPKKKADNPIKRCLEIIKERTGDKYSPEKQKNICNCAIKITTDENPDLGTQYRIYNECIK